MSFKIKELALLMLKAPVRFPSKPKKMHSECRETMTNYSLAQLKKRDTSMLTDNPKIKYISKLIARI